MPHCRICGRQFKTESELRGHLERMKHQEHSLRGRDSGDFEKALDRYYKEAKHE